MLNRTHFVITLFLVLLVLPLVNFKFIFVSIAIISSVIPDVDIKTSFIGKYKIFRPLQIFVTHRGFFHSFLFMALLLTFFLSFYPVGAFAFFIGYGSHLLADSFTVDGVQLFYPLEKKSSGFIRTGKLGEQGILIGFTLADVLMIFWRLAGA